MTVWAKVSSSVLAALLPRAAATAAELTAVVLAVRILGLELYGTYQTAAVAGGLGALALDVSRQTTGTRDIGASLSMPVYRRLSRPRRRTAAVLAAAAAIAYLVGHAWWGAGLAVAAATMIEQRWALLATGRRAALGLSYLARPTAAIVVLAAVAWSDAGRPPAAQYALPLAAAAGGLVVAVQDQRIANRELAAANVPLTTMATVRDRLPLTLAALLAAAYVSGDLILVKVFGDSEQAGIYALAYKPVIAVLVLVSLVRDLWIAAMAAVDGRSKAPSLKQAFVGSAIVAALLAAVTAVVRPLYLVSGSRQADTVTIILLASVVPIVVSSWYYARAVTLHRLSAPLPAVVAALLVDLAANAALVPSLGAAGGAWATLLAELVSTGAAGWVLFHPRRQSAESG